MSIKWNFVRVRGQLLRDHEPEARASTAAAAHDQPRHRRYSYHATRMCTQQNGRRSRLSLAPVRAIVRQIQRQQ